MCIHVYIYIYTYIYIQTVYAYGYICIYGYIYTNILGQNFENETNEDYIKAQKHYNITEYENEASKIAKSCDIKGDTIDLNKLNI